MRYLFLPHFITLRYCPYQTIKFAIIYRLTRYCESWWLTAEARRGLPRRGSRRAAPYRAQVLPCTLADALGELVVAAGAVRPVSAPHPAGEPGRHPPKGPQASGIWACVLGEFGLADIKASVVCVFYLVPRLQPGNAMDLRLCLIFIHVTETFAGNMWVGDTRL